MFPCCWILLIRLRLFATGIVKLKNESIYYSGVVDFSRRACIRVHLEDKTVLAFFPACTSFSPTHEFSGLPPFFCVRESFFLITITNYIVNPIPSKIMNHWMNEQEMKRNGKIIHFSFSLGNKS